MALYSIETQGRMEPHVRQEWLLTNGLGAYSSSTVVGCNTRRYHGLLCAATLPPVGRVIALNRVGEMLFVDGVMLELGVNQFGNDFHPRGERYLKSFELDGGVAKFAYEAEGVRVVKEVVIAWMRNVVGVKYAIEAPAGKRVQLRLQPFVSLRDFHSLVHEEVKFEVKAGESAVEVAREGKSVYLMAEGATFAKKEEWWHRFTYAIEMDRGLDDTEHLFAPGQFVVDVNGKGATATIWASMEGKGSVEDWEKVRASRPDPTKAARETKTVAKPSVALTKLLNAAADFVVARKAPDGSPGTTIIAGYPWFADWGRDTMISLPGLLLTTGRYAEARQVLSVFAQYVDQGMIPNRFDDYTNHPEYNTVDASLWFIHAAFEYLKATGDKETFEGKLRPACRAIIDGYRKGTRYHIGMDPTDGLITQGDAQTQLTWMDAKCGDTAFTPRQGKPVEINALWYHALMLIGEKELAEKVAKSFREQFWISPFRGLADVVDGGNKDQSIRPNQIFAVSLEHSPLTAEQRAAVVEVVRRELLTPVGLRSLARGDSKYQPVYRGNQWVRDSAYHNGTVWSWLIGAFVEAYLRVNKNSAAAQSQAREWLSPLIKAMDDEAACIGQISEIYEPEAPYRAVGCCAQAWSVGEVLRMAVVLGM